MRQACGSLEKYCGSAHIVVCAFLSLFLFLFFTQFPAYFFFNLKIECMMVMETDRVEIRLIKIKL